MSDFTSWHSDSLAWTNLDVVRKQAVEKVDVGVAQHREVLVLLNVGLLHLEDTEACDNCQLRSRFKLAKKSM